MSISVATPNIPAITSGIPSVDAELYSLMPESTIFNSTKTDLGNPLPTLKLLHPLGQGAYGKVFVGAFPGVEGSVAVKAIPKNLVNSLFS